MPQKKKTATEHVDFSMQIDKKHEFWKYVNESASKKNGSTFYSVI